MADTDLLMPPVALTPEEGEEERRRNASRALSMPPVGPSNRVNQPGSREYNLTVGATTQPKIPAPRTMDVPEQPDLGASAQPAMPAVRLNQPARPEAPVTPTAMPPAGKAEMATPTVQPGAMPGVKASPQMEAYEKLSATPKPELSGWKKALDVIGSIFPIGRTIETAIPGTPQNWEAKLGQAGVRAAREQKLESGQREAQAETEKAQFATPEKRRAYMEQHPEQFEDVSDFQKNDFVLAGKFPQKEPAEEKPHDVVKQYSDALASGDDAKAKELEPKVRQFMDATQKAKPDASDKKIDEWVDANNVRWNRMQKADGSTYNEKVGTERAPAATPGSTPTDAHDIAAAIRAGTQPPDTKGLYRNASPVRAELARMGYDLAAAERDWQATQKYMATLNGSQQTRLRQAVESTKGYLDQTEDIYNQWLKIGKTSGWKAFNKGSLAAAKQLPGEPGNLAHRLEARIADLTSDLGTVYKGGNSSTDESLKLAAKNLEGDWNEKTFNDAVGDIRKSIMIRENSMKNLGPAGVSPNSPYTPPEESGGASPFDTWKAKQKKP